MSSRYLLFSVHGEGGPVRCVGHWRRRPTDAQVAAMREGGERHWWLVECPNVAAGRAIIADSTGYECGICSHYHSARWDGDCREDAARYSDPDHFSELIDMEYVDEWRRHNPGRILNSRVNS